MAGGGGGGRGEAESRRNLKEKSETTTRWRLEHGPFSPPPHSLTTIFQRKCKLAIEHQFELHSWQGAETRSHVPCGQVQSSSHSPNHCMATCRCPRIGTCDTYLWIFAHVFLSEDRFLSTSLYLYVSLSLSVYCCPSVFLSLSVILISVSISPAPKFMFSFLSLPISSPSDWTKHNIHNILKYNIQRMLFCCLLKWNDFICCI